MRKYISLTAALALGAFAASSTATAKEDDKTVDCTLPEPQSIQDVLAGVDPDPGETLTITVRGVCTEDLTIVSDDITLQGETGPSVDGVTGGIIVDGAHRVVIENLAVSGSAADGILVENGAAATVSNSTITGNPGQGIHVRLGATAQINGNTISGNDQWAVIVVEAGSARLRSNTITTAHIGGAIGVYRNASLRLNGGNTITNTNGAGNAIGIEVFHVSNIRQDLVDDRGADVLTANRAVSVGNISTVDLRAFVVNGNANVFNQGSLRLRNGTFDGDISATALFSLAQKRSDVLGAHTCTGTCLGF
jgi:parallel beta-helix repeat protein